MPHSFLLALWLGLSALLSACAPKPNLQPSAASQHIQTGQGSQILVTFADEREDRVPVSDGVSNYRARGEYGNSTWSLHIAQALADEYGLKPLTQWPITSLRVHCVVFEVPNSATTDDILQRLRKDTRVEAVQAMQSFRTLAHSYSDPYFKLQAGLQNTSIESVHQHATGKGISVAVIDTGVDESHPDLNGQILWQQNFVSNSPETADDVHGTAVAGVIAAQANNSLGIVGIAPRAKLMILKACWPISPQKPEAACNSLTLALALDKAISAKPRIINLSLTGQADPLLERLVKKAMAEGSILVASEGSNGQAYFPASVPGVIAVRNEGSTDKPETQGLFAPGQQILTTLPHGSYNFLSGSSFSAAHVSGLIALLLELNPKLDSAQIHALLLDTSRHPSEQSPASVNICQALTKASGLEICSSAAQAIATHL